MEFSFDVIEMVWYGAQYGVQMSLSLEVSASGLFFGGCAQAVSMVSIRLEDRVGFNFFIFFELL